MSFTQAVCFDCWNERNPESQVGPDDPRRSNTGPDERCCDCGAATTSGVYIRVDPSTVPFPS